MTMQSIKVQSDSVIHIYNHELILPSEVSSRLKRERGEKLRLNKYPVRETVMGLWVQFFLWLELICRGEVGFGKGMALGGQKP